MGGTSISTSAVYRAYRAAPAAMSATRLRLSNAEAPAGECGMPNERPFFSDYAYGDSWKVVRDRKHAGEMKDLFHWAIYRDNERGFSADHDGVIQHLTLYPSDIQAELSRLKEKFGRLNIFDVGCGKGYGLFDLVDFAADTGVLANGIGIDIFPYTYPEEPVWFTKEADQSRKQRYPVEKAMALFSSYMEQGKLKFMTSPAEEMPLDSEFAHFLYSGQCFRYSLDPMRFLEEVYRVLAPGGVAFIQLNGGSFLYREGPAGRPRQMRIYDIYVKRIWADLGVKLDLLCYAGYGGGPDVLKMEKPASGHGLFTGLHLVGSGKLLSGGLELDRPLYEYHDMPEGLRGIRQPERQAYDGIKESVDPCPDDEDEDDARAHRSGGLRE